MLLFLFPAFSPSEPSSSLTFPSVQVGLWPPLTKNSFCHLGCSNAIFLRCHNTEILMCFSSMKQPAFTREGVTPNSRCLFVSCSENCSGQNDSCMVTASRLNCLQSRAWGRSDTGLADCNFQTHKTGLSPPTPPPISAVFHNGKLVLMTESVSAFASDDASEMSSKGDA